MFDFPVNPAVNDEYEVAGTLYVWNGYGWVITIPEEPVVVIPAVSVISDTPPPNPVEGQLWFDSSAGNTYIWYVDVDSSQWVIITPQPDPSAVVSTLAQTLDVTQQTQARTNINAAAASELYLLMERVRVLEGRFRV